MSQAALTFTISDNSIGLADGRQVTFAGKILQTVNFDNVVVVLIDWMVTNRNVFAISETGNQLWQIEEQPAIHNGNPCTFLEGGGEYAFVSTWDGLELLIEPLTGRIVKERRERGITTEWVDPYMKELK